MPKKGQPREVILPPPAREALVDVPARLDVPWLFVTPCTRSCCPLTGRFYGAGVEAGPDGRHP
jgi:hypothetical protein